MDERPRIPLTLTQGDKALEATGGLLILLLWTGTALAYPALPRHIPVHYNLAGEVDRHGGRETFFWVPLIVTLLYAGLSWLNRYPHYFNYPTAVTPATARQQYSAATRMIRYLKLSLVLIFGYIQLTTWQVATGRSQSLNGWFLPAVLVLVVAPLVYFMIRSTKKG